MIHRRASGAALAENTTSALRALVIAFAGLLLVTATASASFTPTGSMATPRSHHVAVALPESDGTVQRIMVIGGQGIAGVGAPLNSTEIYSVATGTWSAGPPIPVGRTDLQAVAIPRGIGPYTQGGVFVIGGTNAGGGIETAPLIYNVATNAWTSITAMALAPPRSKMAVAISGARIVMAGGIDGNATARAEVQAFDVSGAGVAVPLGAGANMGTARTQAAATTLPNGRVLVTGGYTGLMTPNLPALATGETFNPLVPTAGWTATGLMTSARADHTAAVADSTRAMIAGGVAQLSTAALATTELYDQAANTFAAAGSMSTARSSQIGLAMRPGWVAQVGGINVANPNGIDSVDSWTPTFAWAGLYGFGGPEAAGAGARTFNTATAIPQTEEILIAGGNTPPLATAVRYQATQPTPTPTPTPVPTATPAPTAVPTPTPNPGIVPVQNQSVAVAPVAGNVFVRIGTSNDYREFKVGEAIPVGTVLDTSDGRVRLTSIFNGVRQTAEFYGGTFMVLQPKGQGGMVELRLVGKPTCSTKKATAAVKRKTKPRVWGDGKGRFRTRGSNSSATVRGTKWLVEERCTGTYTKVDRGIVSVRDFTKHRTLLVKAKRTYLAKPPKKK